MGSSLFGTNAMLLLLLSPDAMFHCIPWTEVLCASPGKCWPFFFSFLSQRPDTVSSRLFHMALLLLKGFFFADVREQSFFPSRSHPLWLLSLLWAAASMTDSSRHEPLARTDRWWIISTAHCPSGACHLTVYKATSIWGLLVLTKQFVLLVMLENKWYLEWEDLCSYQSLSIHQRDLGTSLWLWSLTWICANDWWDHTMSLLNLGSSELPSEYF